MKKYIFEIIIEEKDIEGDEFWEEALEEDPSGIVPLTSTLKSLVQTIMPNVEDLSEIVKLKKYSNE